jgi:hypothetical protein
MHHTLKKNILFTSYRMTACEEHRLIFCHSHLFTNKDALESTSAFKIVQRKKTTVDGRLLYMSVSFFLVIAAFWLYQQVF